MVPISTQSVSDYECIDTFRPDWELMTVLSDQIQTFTNNPPLHCASAPLMSDYQLHAILAERIYNLLTLIN
jgi:hypothetical protein